jgi:hypothetical protein
MLQVFHGGQGPRKPREEKADRDKGRKRRRGETMMEAERCPDILGEGGEGRAWSHDTRLGD